MTPLPNLVPTGEHRHANLGELYRTAKGLVLRAEKDYECSYDVDIYREEERPLRVEVDHRLVEKLRLCVKGWRRSLPDSREEAAIAVDLRNAALALADSVEADEVRRRTT